MITVPELLAAAAFEEIASPLILPASSREEGCAYYPAEAPLVRGGKVFLRSHGTAFNLVSRAAFKAGLRRVYAIGPGLAGGCETPALALVQWFDAPLGAAVQLGDALSGLVRALVQDELIIHGRSCARLAFIIRETP